MNKMTTKITTKKGTTTVLLYVHVPVELKEKIEVYPDGSEGDIEVVSCKLLKSKLKFKVKKQDIINSFEETNTGELQDCFMEELK